MSIPIGNGGGEQYVWETVASGGLNDMIAAIHDGRIPSLFQSGDYGLVMMTFEWPIGQDALNWLDQQARQHLGWELWDSCLNVGRLTFIPFHLSPFPWLGLAVLLGMIGSVVIAACRGVNVYRGRPLSPQTAPSLAGQAPQVATAVAKTAESAGPFNLTPEMLLIGGALLIMLSS